MISKGNGKKIRPHEYLFLKGTVSYSPTMLTVMGLDCGSPCWIQAMGIQPVKKGRLTPDFRGKGHSSCNEGVLFGGSRPVFGGKRNSKLFRFLLD